MRQAPTPPRPDLVRRPQGGFGWLDDRLLREGWFARTGVEAVAVLTLLALAADRRGASFYSRRRMATALGTEVGVVDRGLAKLRELGSSSFAHGKQGLWTASGKSCTCRTTRVRSIVSVLDRWRLRPSSEASATMPNSILWRHRANRRNHARLHRR